MTAAEKLRRAAEVLRERAEAATPGPWHVDRFGQPDKYGPGGWQIVGGLSGQGGAVVADRHARRSDATFIAAMNPTVALAVADWLDDIAGQQEHCEWIVKTYAKYPDVRWPSTTRAIAVADAILAGVEG